MKRLFKNVYWWMGEPKVTAAFVIYAASIFTSHNLGWWECAIDTGATVVQPAVARATNVIEWPDGMSQFDKNVFSMLHRNHVTKDR